METQVVDAVVANDTIGAFIVCREIGDTRDFSEIFCQVIFGEPCCDGGENTRTEALGGFEIAFDHPIIGDTVSLFCRMFIQVTEHSAIFFFDTYNWNTIAKVMGHMKEEYPKHGTEILESWLEERAQSVWRALKNPGGWRETIEHRFSKKSDG